jgi:RNA polymerase sigma factor (sigma-70 family)
MALHPSIHSDLTRQHELDLRRRLARPGRGVTTPSDETCNGLIELVQAARSGDPQAWESLVPRFTPMLRAVARDYRLSAADVDDVVQATWAAAFTHIAQLREPESFSGWLCVTARRQALRTISSHQREIAVEEPRHPDESDHPTFESSLVQEEQRAAVHAAVERLPARQRSLITALFYGSTSSYQALSTKLSMPPGSIGPTRDRALARLRRDRRLASALQPTYNVGR